MAEKKAKIEELKKDTRNANKGSELGDKLLSNSFKKLGAGRSILVDKNNNVIAGNHALGKAKEAGINEILVVETDGKKLVVVKRTDLDINTKEGREMALADNSTAKAGIVFDTEVVKGLSEEFDIDVEELGIDLQAIGGGGPFFNDDDYDNDETDASRQMETGGGETNNSVENIFPLSITLNKAQKLGWEDFKKKYQYKTDQEAFNAIYKHAKDTL